VTENAGINGTVPISVWRGEDMSSTELLIIEFFCAEMSVRPRVCPF